MKNMEQVNRIPLNLQFFADPFDAIGDDFIDDVPDSTPNDTETVDASTPWSEQGHVNQSATDEESFTDLDLLPDEYKNSRDYKLMQRDYTRKTQEIAAYRKSLTDAGMSANEAANFIRAMNDNPIDTMGRLAETLGYQLTPAQQKQLEQAADKLQDARDDLEIDPDDEYAQQLMKAAEKRILKQFQPLLDQINPLIEESKALKAEKEAAKKTEAEKFFGDVNTAIEKLVNDYPETGLTKEQLFEIAREHRILPKDMDSALLHALGVDKYLDLKQKQQLKSKVKTALENQKSVAPMVSGKPVHTGQSKPKSFDEATKNILSMLDTMT